jgi:cellobiose-specific phosphotransferase system component IIC
MPARRNDQIPHPEKPKPAADVPTAPWAAASKEQAKKTGMSWKQRTFLTVIAAIAALQWVVALNDMASDDGSDTSAATGLRHLFTAIIVTVVVIRQYLRWRKRK